MSILWCGGEDVDFPYGAVLNVETTSAYRRAAYSRCSLYGAAIGLSRNIGVSPFVSAWLSFRVAYPSAATSIRFAGLAKSSADASGLYVGTSTSSSTKLALYTWNGSAFTQIAAESGTSFTATTSGNPHKIDLQVSDYGASSTVNCYLNGSLLFSFTGDCRSTGVTDLNAVGVRGAASSGCLSELVVADEDTRLFSLATSYPSAAGDANAWTGAYTDIDETTINDADIAYSTVAGQDAQFALSDLPVGTFTVKAVKIAARAAKGASGIAGLSLGVKSGGSVDVDAAHTLTTSWTTEERLMASNPVTSNAWQVSEINALQLNLRSEA